MHKTMIVGRLNLFSKLYMLMGIVIAWLYITLYLKAHIISNNYIGLLLCLFALILSVYLILSLIRTRIIVTDNYIEYRNIKILQIQYNKIDRITVGTQFILYGANAKIPISTSIDKKEAIINYLIQSVCKTWNYPIEGDLIKLQSHYGIKIN